MPVRVSEGVDRVDEYTGGHGRRAGMFTPLTLLLRRFRLSLLRGGRAEKW